jgi:nucleoside phosphorylase
VLGVVTGLKSEAKLLEGLGLACVSTGGRADSARSKIDRLLAGGATGLVSFGIAGALAPDLKTGDLVIAEAVVGESGERWQAHQPWIDALLSTIAASGEGRPDDVPHHAAARRSEGHAAAGPLWSSEHDLSEGLLLERPTPSVTSAVRPGPMAGVTAQGRDDEAGRVRAGAILGRDHMLSSPTEKADAFTRTAALVADMESHHVAGIATERNLPFIAVRAVSDQAGEVLPAIMASFVDAGGATKMSAVLAALISGRVKLGSLLQAGRASKRAHQSLLRCRGALAGLG